MDTSNMWYSALEALPKETELETVEQRIAYANVLALLSVSQEINSFVLGESPLGRQLMESHSERGSGASQVPFRAR